MPNLTTKAFPVTHGEITDRHTDRHLDRYTDKHTDRQRTDIQTDIWTDTVYRKSLKNRRLNF